MFCSCRSPKSLLSIWFVAARTAASVRSDVILARVSADDGGGNHGLLSPNPTLGVVLVGLVDGGSDVNVLVHFFLI